jgi:hypothetical protein
MLAAGPGPSDPAVPWERLVETGRSHCVMPALSWCLRDDRNVPPELRSYLDAVLRLNGKRNERICNSLEQVIRALNAADIEPILLKGVAHLAGGIYPSPAVRLMSDVDVLVPQARALAAVAAMEGIGFTFDEAVPDGYFHLSKLRHTESNIVIELHTLMGHAQTDRIAPVSWVEEQSRRVAFRGLQVRTPGPAVLVAHNVTHDQLIHARYQFKQVELRQLLDLALIRARHEKEIDWREVNGKFDNAGMGHVLATYLHYAEVLLGQPMPAIESAPRTQAIGRLRRSMEDPLEQRRARRARERALREQKQARVEQRAALRRRWASRLAMVSKLPMAYINERRRDPRGLVRLLDPRAWARQLGDIGRTWKRLK